MAPSVLLQDKIVALMTGVAEEALTVAGAQKRFTEHLYALWRKNAPSHAIRPVKRPSRVSHSGAPSWMPEPQRHGGRPPAL
jgi:hypothetical protein